MLRKKIAVHFDLLVARGLNPHRITGDAEHDNQALFEYVLWQVTERNLLRMLGYPYDVSRRAVNCYIEHANRLHGLSPRRMALLAALFREDLPAQTLEVELASHLAKSGLRRKLKVRSSGLPWPDRSAVQHGPTTGGSATAEIEQKPPAHSPNPMSQRISLRNRRTSRSPNRPQRRSSPNWWYPRQRSNR
jgi:hypothetical protein